MTHEVQLPNGSVGVFPDDMPDDQIEAVIQKQFPPTEKSQIEPTPFNPKESQIPETPFNGMPPPKPERTGITAPLVDLAHALSQGGKDIVKFGHNVPGNLEKIGQDLEKHPLAGQGHILGQLGAGAADLAKSVVNTPHDLFKYMLKKHLAFDIPIPGTKLGTSDLIPHIPEDTGVEKALGLEANSERGDELTRAIPAIAGGLQGAKSLVKGGIKAFKGPDLHQAIRDTQKVVNEATADAGKVFDKVEAEVGKRGLAHIPIDPAVIEHAEGFLPATKANKALLEKAKTGDYTALRKLQSDLRVKAEKAMSSALKAENDEGELIHETREDINQSIANHLKDTGHKDLAEDLQGTREKYRDIKKTYFSSPALAKVFGASQKVPKNPLTLLSEESTEMKKFMSKHPEVEKAMVKALKHKRNMKLAGKAAGLAVSGATAGGTYKALSK